MRGIGRVLENSFLYTFSSLLVKAIGFLLLPVYTLFLTPEDYGTTNLVNSFNSVATFILAFSLYVAVIRFYVDYKDDR
ncbi:MAG: oligosaccharide flippase family protein, partial [Clostridium sp.]|nr:oligosaccharide flippase family protein [Clostridium sp.]